MYDLVGERLREIFDAQVARHRDLRPGCRPDPLPVHDRARRPVPRRADPAHRHPQARHRDPRAAADERSRGGAGRASSASRGSSRARRPSRPLWAPLVVGGEATGVISLQNLDREVAFTDADLRAPDDARREPQRRARERAAHPRDAPAASPSWRRSTRSARRSRASSTSTACTSSSATGCGETFAADLVYVAMHDTATGRIEFAYYSEDGGDRRREPGIAFGEGLTSHILRTREPLLLNRDEDFDAVRHARRRRRRPSPTSACRSCVGDQAIGVISVQSMKVEGRFGRVGRPPAGDDRRERRASPSRTPSCTGTRGRRADEMAALADVAREISATLDLDGRPRADGGAGADPARGRHERRLPRRTRTAQSFRAIVALGRHRGRDPRPTRSCSARASSAGRRRAAAARDRERRPRGSAQRSRSRAPMRRRRGAAHGRAAARRATGSSA